jgi:hypothetical protein
MATHHLAGPSVAAACPYDFGDAVRRVAESHRRAGALRRESAALLEAHLAGTATPAMRHRYVRVTMALILNAMPRALPTWSDEASGILRRHQQLELESIVGPLEDVDEPEGDPSPAA